MSISTRRRRRAAPNFISISSRDFLHDGEFAQPFPQSLHLPLAHRAFLGDAVDTLSEDIKFAVLSKQFHLHTVARLLPVLGQEIFFQARRTAFRRSHQVLHRRVGDAGSASSDASPSSAWSASTAA